MTNPVDPSSSQKQAVGAVLTMAVLSFASLASAIAPGPGEERASSVRGSPTRTPQPYEATSIQFLTDVARTQDALALIRQLPIQILAVDEQAVFSAAHIKANFTLSYADAFAVAAAINERAVILTGDPEFEAVKSIIDVEWLERTT